MTAMTPRYLIGRDALEAIMFGVVQYVRGELKIEMSSDGWGGGAGAGRGRRISFVVPRSTPARPTEEEVDGVVELMVTGLLEMNAGVMSGKSVTEVMAKLPETQAEREVQRLRAAIANIPTFAWGRDVGRLRQYVQAVLDGAEVSEAEAEAQPSALPAPVLQHEMTAFTMSSSSPILRVGDFVLATSDVSVRLANYEETPWGIVIQVVQGGVGLVDRVVVRALIPGEVQAEMARRAAVLADTGYIKSGVVSSAEVAQARFDVSDAPYKCNVPMCGESGVCDACAKRGAR